jgi:uncharacterized protein
VELCELKQIERGYVVTKSLDDFGPLKGLPVTATAQVMKVPAPLLCFWLGETEVLGTQAD